MLPQKESGDNLGYSKFTLDYIEIHFVNNTESILLKSYAITAKSRGKSLCINGHHVGVNWKVCI